MAEATESTASFPTVPKEWPGAWGAYKHSKQAVKPVLWKVVGLYVGIMVVSIVFSTLFSETKAAFWSQLVAQVVAYVVSAMILILFLAGVKGKSPSIEDTLNKSLPFLVRFFLLSILTGLILVGSLLLFIVPFFFVLPRVVLAPYFLFDQNLGIIESLKASWNQTKGNAGKVWGTIGAEIAMSLLFITIIGIPFAIYFLVMYSAVQAVLYSYIAKQKA